MKQDNYSVCQEIIVSTVSERFTMIAGASRVKPGLIINIEHEQNQDQNPLPNWNIITVL